VFVSDAAIGRRMVTETVVWSADCTLAVPYRNRPRVSNAMMSQRAQRLSGRAGYSIIELLANVALLSVVAAATLPHIDARRQDINSATEQLTSDYRWARVRAITASVHFALNWTDARTYQVERMKESVPGTWVLDTVVKQVTLPTTVNHSGMNRIEFNTRGLMVSSAATVLQTLADSTFGATRVLAVYPSGQTNEYS
jgi:Tfp pilus assembly protein FimT